MSFAVSSEILMYIVSMLSACLSECEKQLFVIKILSVIQVQYNNLFTDSVVVFSWN
jgi:hypothetical protein